MRRHQEMPQAAGTYRDGWTAAIHPVQVVLETNALRWAGADGNLLGAWTLSTVTVADEGAGRWRLTSHEAPEASLSVSDALLVDELRQRLPQPKAKPRSPWPRVLLFGAAVLAVLAAAAMALPWVSRAIAHRLPARVETQLALNLDPFFAKRQCSSPQGQDALDELVSRLRAGDSGVRGRPRARVVDWDLVNALTLPGGSIIVTRGLLEQADSPDELAGVLGHELEHVARRHIMTQLVRAALLTGAWTLAVGDISGLLVVDPATMVQIASRKYSRDDEREADEGAVRRLRAAGIDGRGFATFFDRLAQRQDDTPELLSTHPPSELRAQVVAQLFAQRRGPSARDVETPPAPALTPAAWQAVRTMCYRPAAR